MKNKIAKIVCTSLLLTLVVASNALAAGRLTYTAYKLPSFQRNNYTGVHVKENKRNYVTNHVTAVSNAGGVTFWVTDENYNQISTDYRQKSGNETKLFFTSQSYAKKGKQICMGMENSEWTMDTAFVSGWVNFH